MTLCFTCFFLSVACLLTTSSMSDFSKRSTDISSSSTALTADYNNRRMSFYKGESGNVSLLIEKLLHGYDQRLRPNYKGSPVKVGITMHVSSVSSISEVNMDFTLDFYFRQYWHDERLMFSEPEDELCISNEMLNKLWWPDTFFANAKQERFHETTTKNAFLRISQSGWITQSLRLTVTASCSMDLKLFPMDSQICPIEIESYAYSDKHIYYWWKENKITYRKDMQLPQFELKGYNVSIETENLSTGNYSRLACKLYFVRRLGYYIIQIYLPSSLIVVLSWVSFWLDRTAVPARVSLGITTVLTMTTLISSTNASLPKISYLKSIDIYLVTCFCMVFSALLEFAAVSYLGNRKWKPRPPVIFIDPNPPYNDDRKLWRHHSEQMTMEQNKTKSDKTQTRLNAIVTRSTAQGCNPNVLQANAIDRYSRAIFPIVFIVFCCVYWLVYTNANPNVNLDGFVIE